MHAEYFRVPQETAEAIVLAKRRGNRVVAVGTTVVRALESAALFAGGKAQDFFEAEEGAGAEESAPGALIRPCGGWTRLLIYTPFTFQITDALITNFHLPRSTLILLVAAFGGCRNVKEAYRVAIDQKYRFYSFGDAMLVD